jgi:hypothetical protein
VILAAFAIIAKAVVAVGREVELHWPLVDRAVGRIFRQDVYYAASGDIHPYHLLFTLRTDTLPSRSSIMLRATSR